MQQSSLVRFLEAPVDFQNLQHLPHRGTYTVDGAGRLNQVVDTATNTTENYVWNADGTLASFPGPGYTRLLEYERTAGWFGFVGTTAGATCSWRMSMGMVLTAVAVGARTT